MSLTYLQTQTVVTPDVITTDLAGRVNVSIGFYLAAVMVESPSTTNHLGRFLYAKSAFEMPLGRPRTDIRRNVLDVMNALGYDDTTAQATVQTAVNSVMDTLITQ